MNNKKRSLLKFSELVVAVGGNVLPYSGNEEIVFTSVATDSRNVIPGALFVPLIGEFQDGHRYIPEALKKGASIVFIAESEYAKNTDAYKDLAYARHTAFITVPNTLAALQNAASAYVRQFQNLIRIGITGSSGKTTTKEIAAAILRQKYRVVCNEGNLNSETGLPLSVFKIRDDTEIGLFEMGMNRRNEIGEIAAVLRPQYAVITNIGTAHIGILGSRQNIADEKKKIFSYIDKNGAAFIPVKDDFAEFLASGVNGRIVYYGTDPSDAAVCGIRFIKDKGIEGTVFSVDGIEITLPLPGKYNYSNAVAAVSLTRCLGVDPVQIKKGIECIEPLTGRGKISHISLNGRTLTLFEDCYNANPDSLSKTLEFCASIPGRKIFVLGDMLELGTASHEAHGAIVKLASGFLEKTGGMLILVGNEMKTAAESGILPEGVDVVSFALHDDETITSIAELIYKSAFDGDFILLKGSHGIGLERVAVRLEEYFHG